MIFRFACVSLWRNRKIAEFRVLGMALGLAVFAVTLITCLTQTLGELFIKDATALIGADLIIESPHTFSPKLLQKIESNRLEYSKNVEFLSMLSMGEQFQIANVNAIVSPFPLRGQVIVEKTKTQVINQIPAPGEIWLERSLIDKLDATFNQSLQIGNVTLKITGVIVQHPLALSGSNVLAPLAYVNYNDLEKLGILQPGSRATYRILLKSDRHNAAGIQKIIAALLPKEARMVAAANNNRGLSKTIVKVHEYLSTVLLIQVLLAGIAVGMCAHQFSVKQQRNVALMRCLGASSGMLFSIYIIELLLLACVVILLAIVMSYGVAALALHYAKTVGFYSGKLNSDGGILGAITGLLLLLGFALPPIVELRKVPPSKIFQGAYATNRGVQFSSYALAMVALLGLLCLLVNEPQIALQLAVKIFILSTIAYGLAWVLWFTFKPLSHYGGLVWRFGITYLIRHKTQSINQWLVFTLVIMSLVLLQIIKQDFLEQWRSQLPKEAPNYFLINVQPDQITPIQRWLVQQGISNIGFYPIVQARWSHRNGVPLSEGQGLSRSINLTWMSQLPQDNQVIIGQKWTSALGGQNVISVEQGFAQRYNLQVNDTMSFQLGEAQITAKIIQIRALEWTSLKPNFFIIFPEKIINDFPHSYITSLYVPKDKKTTLIALNKKFVEISMIDIDEIVTRIRSMIEKLSKVLEILLLIVFSLGVLILYSGLISTLKERIQESAMLQILGASKSFMAKILLVEFGFLGLLSGLVGSLMAILLAKDLAARYFNMVFQVNMQWLWYPTLLSTIVIALLGLAGTRKVFRVSPLRLLRE